MKVLLLSVFHPELVPGGAQQICYELFEGLKAREGVDVTLLCAIEPRFTSLYKSGARITGFDGRPGEYLFLSRDYDYFWNKASNTQLLESYAEFLREIRPDVVHMHHFLLFGVNLIPLTRRVLPNVRLVFTFHEFLSICFANGQMLRTTDRSLCERASNVRCHQCFPDLGPEQFMMREMWMKRHLAEVDQFTTPSQFMIEHYVEWGLDRSKITHITNGQRDYSGGSIPKTINRKRNHFGFFGQLVDNKGVWVIIQAVERLRSEGFTDFVIEINGDNLRYASEGRRKEIEQFREVELKRPIESQNVIFNGSYHVNQLRQRMARVDWCIVPSTWWEIFGLVISEAWMFRRPVIASDVGGPKERIRDNIDGLLFAVGDSRALAETIYRACTEEGLWETLVQGIRPPPTRDLMVDDYMAIYGQEPIQSKVGLSTDAESAAGIEVKFSPTATPVRSAVRSGKRKPV
jgi:glycosyltransferase involved in cell wall biosynthesis